MGRRWVIVFAIISSVVAMLLVLSACTGDFTPSTGTGAADYQRTLEAADAQRAEAAFQITSQAVTEQAMIQSTAGAAEQIRLATQSALDAKGTEVALALTQSVATQSAQETATWVVATQQQVAFNDAVQKTKTHLDLEELNRKNKAAQDTQTFNTWAGRVGLILLLLVMVILLIYSWPWILLRFFGIDTTNGKVMVIIPRKNGGVISLDPDRGFGAGVVTDPTGHVVINGMADDPGMQDRTTARSQAANMVRALPRFGGNGTNSHVLRAASSMGATPLPAQQSMLALPPGDVIEGMVREVPPEDPEIKGWLDDIEGPLLGPGE